VFAHIAQEFREAAARLGQRAGCHTGGRFGRIDRDQQAAGPALRSGMELSWFSGYHASSQLAPGLQASAHYRITQWPNFGLIRPLPSQLRVAAGLSSAAADLSEIIKRAGVAAEEAVRTLNALHACGVLIAIESGGAATRATPASLAEPRGGFTQFLRNVRKHLGLGA
jgi:hypothetical protein